MTGLFCKRLPVSRWPGGANTAPDARFDIHARGFWSRQGSTFSDVRLCHPNAERFRDVTPQQIYRQHENEKKRMYANRVMEVEQATFTPLVLPLQVEVYHKRLAELLSFKKGKNYSTAMSWIRTRVSFAILRTSLLCLRGSRSLRRVNLDLK